MLLLIRHFQMQLFLLAFRGLINVLDVYTEILAQDDKLLLIPRHFQLLPMFKVDQFELCIHEVPPLQ